MPETPQLNVRPVPVAEALAAVATAPHGLLALGIPGCAACMLLPPSLDELGRARPDLAIAMGEFAGPADWMERERLLWPRGVHVSRSSMPTLTLLADGEAIASRPGGGPAMQIDAWLEAHLGPAPNPPGDQPTAAETAALGDLSARIGRQAYVKGRAG